jgi:hypothetical protein
MGDLTIIYYTSNREEPEFEKWVQETLLKAAGDLPIISVSQKPIDFGENICVGDIGATATNMLLQIQTGAKKATTPFVSTAEADCLYHKSYYDFKPKSENTIYRSDELYILWIEKPGYFYLKSRKEIGGITGRKYLISVIDKLLAKPFKHLSNVINEYSESEYFHSEIPMVSLKTKNGMHYGSSINRKKSQRELPYWGKSRELAREYA